MQHTTMCSNCTVNDYVKDHAPDMDPTSIQVISARKMFSGDDTMAGLTLAQEEDGTITVAEKKDGVFFNVCGHHDPPLLQYEKNAKKLWVDDRFGNRNVLYPFSNRVKVGSKITSVQGETDFCCLGQAEKLLRDALKQAAAKHGHGVHEGIMAGLTLQEGEDGMFIIKEIKHPSPFARTKLQAGDKVYAINGETEFCCMGKAEKIIREAEHVSIITDAKESATLMDRLPKINFRGLKLFGNGKVDMEEEKKPATNKAAEEAENPAEQAIASAT